MIHGRNVKLKFESNAEIIASKLRLQNERKTFYKENLGSVWQYHADPSWTRPWSFFEVTMDRPTWDRPGDRVEISTTVSVGEEQRVWYLLFTSTIFDGGEQFLIVDVLTTGAVVVLIEERLFVIGMDWMQKHCSPVIPEKKEDVV